MNYDEKNYYESLYHMAELNHSESVGTENLGWTRGVLSDGVPFEAEIWIIDGQLSLCVMVPEIFGEKQKLRVANMEIVEHCEEVQEFERMESGVLKIGMIDRGYVEDYNVIISYVEYLEEFNLVNFYGERRNGAVRLFKDKEGNCIAGVIITLNEEGEVFADTPLVFKSFNKDCHGILMYKKMNI